MLRLNRGELKNLMAEEREREAKNGKICFRFYVQCLMREEKQFEFVFVFIFCKLIKLSIENDTPSTLLFGLCFW